MDSSSTFLKSDSSSDDLDHQLVYDESSDTTTKNTKRSYECTYCKRGFTNAQALGGHMNIHRKDRAKAKQSHNNRSNSSFSKTPLSDQDYFGNTSSDHAERYHMYNLPSMVPNPTNYYYHPQQVLYYGNDFSASRSNEEGACANLSLRIGSTYLEDRVNDEHKDHGVDLELRLGPDP